MSHITTAFSSFVLIFWSVQGRLLCPLCLAGSAQPHWLLEPGTLHILVNYTHRGGQKWFGIWETLQVFGIWTLLFKCHHSGIQSGTIIENKSWPPNSELTSTRAHPATSLPFPNSSSWQEVSTAGVKKRMWAEHLPEAANQHNLFRGNMSRATHCVLWRGGCALPMDFY